MRPALPLRAQRGFTATELMVTIAIVAILAAVAAPSFSDIMARQRTRAVSSDLFTSLTRARSEAIKRNTDITLAAAGEWHEGWAIPNPADSGNPIDVHGPFEHITVDGPSSVVFTANGRVRATEKPTFTIEFDGNAHTRCVGVDLSGRPYQKSEAC